jgi:4-hydroxythreonine-4-phosphate dehydrogenase
MTSSNLPLAVSVGCPSGIGPEVAVAAASAFPHPLVLVGDAAQLAAIARTQGVSLDRHAVVSPVSLAARDRRPGKPTQAGGRAQLAWIDEALDLVTSGRARGLVTGPVSKEAIASSGAPGSASFRGHTEHLQARLGAREVVMAFWSRELTCALVTTHLPLARVPAAIRPEKVASATYWLADLLHRLTPDRALTLAISGLNPHAGEGGLLGTEETTRIGPGMTLATARIAAAGLPVRLVGPVGAESAFRLAKGGSFDGVVAMYHDQATIPMKLLGFGEAVNVSLGLPIVRTSVDHGTGYDRAGQGTADARGMAEALALAHSLTSAPRATPMSGSAPRRAAKTARK